MQHRRGVATLFCCPSDHEAVCCEAWWCCLTATLPYSCHYLYDHPSGDKEVGRPLGHSGGPTDIFLIRRGANGHLGKFVLIDSGAARQRQTFGIINSEAGGHSEKWKRGTVVRAKTVFNVAVLRQRRHEDLSFAKEDFIGVSQNRGVSVLHRVSASVNFVPSLPPSSRTRILSQRLSDRHFLTRSYCLHLAI